MNFLSKPIPDVGLYAFWDIDKTKLDFNQDKYFIVSRMFERGKLNVVLKIIYYYGIHETKSILKPINISVMKVCILPILF